MQFWDAQTRAKKRSLWLFIAFFLMTMVAATASEFLVRSFWPDYSDAESSPLVAIGFIAATFAVALFNYSIYQAQGGAAIAKSLGAGPNPQETPKERELQNIIQEMALAASFPVPTVYILENPSINAFAAGTTAANSCICVTTGSLQKLSRDELQGVIGHEFSHLVHEDAKIGMRLAAMLMGFFFLSYIALRMIQFAPRRSQNQKQNPTLLIAIALLAAGALSWFFGKILSAMVSREREYLADASAVQYTRNPNGLIGALQKIAKESSGPDAMPKSGMAFSHLYFSHISFFGSLFATHPPLEKRIEALQGK